MKSNRLSIIFKSGSVSTTDNVKTKMAAKWLVNDAALPVLVATYYDSAGLMHKIK